jgi:hypothetical protein
MSGLLTLLVAQRGYRHSSRPHLAARQFFWIRRPAANQLEV